jgi:hypothetical protein
MLLPLTSLFKGSKCIFFYVTKYVNCSQMTLALGNWLYHNSTLRILHHNFFTAYFPVSSLRLSMVPGAYISKKLHGLSPRANYTDRATAACRRSDCQLLRIKGATWSARRIPTAVFSVEPLLFYQVAPQLYSRGWVDPVPDPLPFFLVVPGIEPGPPDL